MKSNPSNQKNVHLLFQHCTGFCFLTGTLSKKDVLSILHFLFSVMRSECTEIVKSYKIFLSDRKAGALLVCFSAETVFILQEIPRFFRFPEFFDVKKFKKTFEIQNVVNFRVFYSNDLLDSKSKRNKTCQVTS